MSQVLPVSKAHPASKEPGASLAIPGLVVQVVSKDQLDHRDLLDQQDQRVNKFFVCIKLFSNRRA